ncbi:unnamed protein product [Paramecium primaurelia]|uniref:H-type lectin domain-containing protein n=1 Tax=Paramecium primaurelia TaxID=5886 RepID=A0A8S1NTV3_PARPR|nr:unnamed protein product [Paramecium primaurelia]
MLIFIFPALIQFVLSYILTRYEVGDVTVMTSGGNHILENSRIYPRQIQTAINFQTVFDTPPELFLSPHYYDWSLELPHGFLVKATLITRTGFLLNTLAVAASQLFAIRIKWFAFQDSRISVITFQQNDVQELQTGTGDRTITFSIDHEFKDATNGLISLNGVKHIKSNQIVEVKIEQVQSKSIDVSVSIYSDSQIEYVRFNILLGTDQSLWSSAAQAEIFNPPLYGNQYGSIGYLSRQATFLIPSIYLNQDRLPIFAYRGYKFDKNANVRCYVIYGPQTPNLIYNLFVWDSTTSYAFFDQVSLYFPQPQIKIVQPNCAELFSECDYNGDSIVICNNIPDLLQKGWTNQVKSLMISTQKQFYLFNQINYQGQAQKIIQNQQCMESFSILSVKFQPVASIIKVIFINSNLNNNNCKYVYFYSQCNYQGTVYQIQQGQSLDRSNKIPFEIKSISICPNIIVKLRDPSYFGGGNEAFSSSQACLDGYKFPTYRTPN